MPETRRRSPFVWVTWLTGLLSGDKHCQFALWYRAQFEYEKRADPKSADLSKWKADHARMVDARAQQIRDLGWTVRVEAQNKFIIHGETAALSANPDLVALGTDLSGEPVAIAEDCKTGKHRDSDYWQVVVYMLFLPLAFRELLAGRRLSGTVVYRDQDVDIHSHHADAAAKAAVAGFMRMAGGPNRPPTTPSAGECSFCDVLSCPDRIADERPAMAETSEF